MSDLVLPWPPKELSPNARKHWAVRSRIAKRYRITCRLLAMQAGISAPITEKILLSLEFVPADRRHRDDDNLVASFKAGRDGLADALGIDDNRFVTQFRLSDETTKGGAVRVLVQEYLG